MKEAFIRPSTMRGTVLDLNVSKDREQGRRLRRPALAARECEALGAPGQGLE